MNLKEIKEIIKLMNENDLAEMEVEREGAKLKLKKSGHGVIQSVVHQPVVPQSAPNPSVPAKSSESASAPASAATNTKQILSPMVGTFYRAPSPEAPAFAEVGQMVEVGQVVCIVEAMKLMNEIKSEVRGKVREISVANAEPVEFGQVLFEIEPV